MGEDSRAERARRRRIATALRRRDARAARRNQTPGSILGFMPDLSRYPLGALGTLNETVNPVLRSVLQRLRAEAGGQQEALAGFNSAL